MNQNQFIMSIKVVVLEIVPPINGENIADFFLTHNILMKKMEFHKSYGLIYANWLRILLMS